MLIPDPAAIDALLEKIYGSKFYIWEPETLEVELGKLAHPVLSKYGTDDIITNMINAIRAIRHPKSFVLQEWHLLEKALAALTGKEVRFFDAQPPGSILELFLGVELLKAILKNEPEDLGLSDETKLYLGLILIDMGVFSFPFEPYKSIIKFALGTQNLSQEAKREISNFEECVSKLLANPAQLALILKQIQENPDTDILAKINNLHVFNAVTALCSFLAIRENLTSYENTAEAIADNRAADIQTSPEDNSTSYEGIDKDFADEVLRLVDADSKNSLDKTGSVRHRNMPNSGTYIISPDADEFESDHTYDGAGGINGSAAKSVSKMLSAGEQINNEGPKSQKVIDTQQYRTDKSPTNMRDALADLFANLDI